MNEFVKIKYYKDIGFLWTYKGLAFTGVFLYGSIKKFIFCKQGMVHRENGPAIVTESEALYYLNDKRIFPNIIIRKNNKFSLNKNNNKENYFLKTLQSLQLDVENIPKSFELS